MIHIALCFTDDSGTYYKRAATALVSIFANTGAPIHAHIIHDETLADDGKNAIASLCASYSQEVSFHKQKKNDYATYDSKRWSKGTLYRIGIVNTINVDLLLYIDCDIIFNCDVSHIIKNSIQNYYAAAIPTDSIDEPSHYTQFGIKKGRYVNAGVLLLNLKKIREELPDCEKELFDCLQRDGLRYPDQDAINIYFATRENGIAYLPNTYNYRIAVADRINRDFQEYAGKVLHYTGSKPWETFYPAGMYYWKYHALAFPEDNVFDQILALRPARLSLLYSFVLRNETARRWLNRWREVCDEGLLPLLRRRMFPQRHTEKKL